MAAGVLKYARPFLCLTVCLRLSFTSSLALLTITLPAAVLMVTLSAKSEGLGFFSLPQTLCHPCRRTRQCSAWYQWPTHCFLSCSVKPLVFSWQLSPPFTSSIASAFRANLFPSAHSCCSLQRFITKTLICRCTAPCDCPLSADALQSNTV